MLCLFAIKENVYVEIVKKGLKDTLNSKQMLHKIPYFLKQKRDILNSKTMQMCLVALFNSSGNPFKFIK